MSTTDKLKNAFNNGLQLWHDKGNAEWKSKDKKEYNRFRISQMGECAAAQTRSWISGKDEEFNHSSKWRMYEGERMHETARAFLKASNAVKIVAEELHVEKTFTVQGMKITLVGHIDNIIMHCGEKVIVDFKKASESSFSNLKEQGLPDTYYDQLYGYMACTGIKRAVIFMISVAGECHGFELKYSQKQFDAILLRLHDIACHRKERSVGTREYSFGIPPCSWCQHRHECWTPSVKKKCSDTVELLPKYTKLHKQLIVKAKKRRQMEYEVEKLKSQERAEALLLMEKHKATKTLVDPRGNHNISWTRFNRSEFKLDAERIPDVQKKGWGKWTSNEVSFPRINGVSAEKD